MARVQLRLGFAVTILLALLQAIGLTERLEFPLYDLRMRAFNVFTPPPSKNVVLVAVDDGSIETIGKWPWPREYLGVAIRELKRAGASVVALDLLLDDPQPPIIRGEIESPGTLERIDNDRMLAEAITFHGGVVQGASFGYVNPDELDRLRREREGQGRFLAPFDAVYGALKDAAGTSEDALMSSLLPGRPLSGPERDDLARKRGNALSLLAHRDHSGAPAPEDGRWPTSNLPSAPVPIIAESAAGIASVSFGGGDADGAVRRIPLWIRFDDRLFPTLGLAAAARHLGVRLQSAAVDPMLTSLALDGGAMLEIPTYPGRLKDIERQGILDGLMYVPWPRGGWGGWESQFAQERAGGEFLASEIAIGRLLDPIFVIIPSIQTNLARLDGAVEVLDAGLGIGDWKTYGARAREMASLTPESPRWRALYEEQKAAWARLLVDAASMLEQVKSDPSFDRAALTEEERGAIEALERTVSDAPAQIEAVARGVQNLDAWWNVELPSRVAGRVVFVGWSATGALADFVRTSVDARTPGVLVHAAVTNAILNSASSPQFMRRAPLWLNTAAVVVLGALGTLVGVRLGVVVSPMALIAALAAWFAMDGFVFWDWRNVFVAEAAPMLAAATGWLSVILHRLLVEQRGRKQTEARFRSYVSPDVVDILVNNPDMDSMKPQRRELTIFFSDIANWTTLAERLGTEGIGAFLATYLKEMTDILQNNRATIDKYLGDGIMAFWGAPIEDEQHARHAIDAVVRMQEKLQEMNDTGAFGAAGKIKVRIGIASGEVNVGDFGNPPEKSAYTVIGDSANLAARLESANKQFGSLILMTERTRELAGVSEGIRLIGKVVVKGKTEPETLWEPIGSRRPQGARTDEWITLTNDAVRAYIAGDFARSLELFERLEREFEDHELSARYRESIDHIRASGGPGEGFNGSIILSEK